MTSTTRPSSKCSRGRPRWTLPAYRPRECSALHVNTEVAPRHSLHRPSRQRDSHTREARDRRARRKAKVGLGPDHSTRIIAPRHCRTNASPSPIPSIEYRGSYVRFLSGRGCELSSSGEGFERGTREKYCRPWQLPHVVAPEHLRVSNAARRACDAFSRLGSRSRTASCAVAHFRPASVPSWILRFITSRTGGAQRGGVAEPGSRLSDASVHGLGSTSGRGNRLAMSCSSARRDLPRASLKSASAFSSVK